MRQILFLTGLASAIFIAAPAGAQDATGCAAGARCLAVNSNGTPNPNGDYVAQCSGRFPDFVVPEDQLDEWTGEFFQLSQDYPSNDPGTDAPWLGIDFRTPQGADDYILALRDYAFAGMIDADFRPENSSGRGWYHMPMMNFGPGRREFIHGLTEERGVTGPELGLKPGVRIRNFAVGFYNSAAATTIAKVWASDDPDLRDTAFPPGSMAFKILFTTAKATDFADGVDRLAGAPSWSISEGGNQIDLRLMQMDVAAAAPDTKAGWVFGTLAFDPSAADPSPWNRLRPVGLSWGNDEGVTPADVSGGQDLMETHVSGLAPAYAADHLGWAGRMNGPVDNPASGCLSCHGTAQYPRVALLPGRNCKTDDQKLHWFRDVPGTVPFGLVDNDSCEPIPSSGGTPLVALDYSLQMAVAVESVLRYGDVNPCGGEQFRARILRAPMGDFPLTEDIPPESERIHR